MGSLRCSPAAYPMRGRGSVAFMQANDITRDRLRQLAETDVGGAKVLSLFLNLDPREFATPPARSTGGGAATPQPQPPR